MKITVLCINALFVTDTSRAFLVPEAGQQQHDSFLGAKKSTPGSSKGFGNSRAGGGEGFHNSKSKTFDTAAIKDVIDVEAAMGEFFASNEGWSPLFQSVARDESVPAMDYVKTETVFEFHKTSSPWRQLDAKPSSEADIQLLSTFLDAMQQSLVDIPVNEFTKQDEDDLNFLEEGRRMLCLTRFHVLHDNSAGSIPHFDQLFATCWSELAELRRADEDNTGSLIILPNYGLGDLRRFVDINLNRPLDWLGMGQVFEVAAMRREFPAIRLLHKLSDMPTEPYREEQ